MAAAYLLSHLPFNVYYFLLTEEKQGNHLYFAVVRMQTIVINMCVCLFVRSALACLVNYTSKFRQIFSTCDLWPRLEGARLEIPDKLLKPTFSPTSYTALTPHTPISSPSLPGLAH